MMSSSSDYSTTRVVAGFIGGLAVGYGLALLFAPQSGRETRAMLGDYAQSTSENLSSMARNAVTTARSTAQTASQRAAEYAQEGMERVKSQARSAANTGMAAGEEAAKAVQSQR